jgi:hypothetical protein
VPLSVRSLCSSAARAFTHDAPLCSTLHTQLDEYTEKLSDAKKLRRLLKDFLFGKPPYGAVPSKRTWKKPDDEL